MCENWGYFKFAAHRKKESNGQTKCAETLIQRILFLEGTPNTTDPAQLATGATVKTQLENDLARELAVAAMYCRFVRLASEEDDPGSRELFEHA